MTTPEDRARAEIDWLLIAAGWHVCDCREAAIHAARGVAIREFELIGGHGTADYLLYIDGKAAGVIEAKKRGATLTGVERQSDRYAKGLPASLPAWSRPLPFAYQSTGVETRFINGLDLESRSRAVFAFHQPATLAEHHAEKIVMFMRAVKSRTFFEQMKGRGVRLPEMDSCRSMAASRHGLGCSRTPRSRRSHPCPIQSHF